MSLEVSQVQLQAGRGCGEDEVPDIELWIDDEDVGEVDDPEEDVEEVVITITLLAKYPFYLLTAWNTWNSGFLNNLWSLFQDFSDLNPCTPGILWNLLVERRELGLSQA